MHTLESIWTNDKIDFVQTHTHRRTHLSSGRGASKTATDQNGTMDIDTVSEMRTFAVDDPVAWASLSQLRGKAVKNG